MAHAVHLLTLNSAEELQRPIAGAEVRVTQLSTRGIQGALRIVEMGTATLSHGMVDGDFYLEGALSPDRLVLGVLLGAEASVTHWSSEVAVGDLGFFPANRPQTAIYRGAAEYLTIALTEDRLGEFAEQNEFRLSPAQLNSEGIISNGSSAFRLGRNLSHWLRHEPDRFARPGFVAEIRDRFLAAYLSRLDPIAADSRKNPARSRKIVNEVIDIARARFEGGGGIETICADLTIPRRTLHRAFIDVTGLPPAKFLRNYRLNETRRLLLEGRTSVTESAIRCGFSELGKFSMYYRRLFGEAPSATRARLSVRAQSYVLFAAYGLCL